MNDLYNYLETNYSAPPVFDKKPTDKKIFIVIKPGFLEKSSLIVDMFKKAGFELFQIRTKRLTIEEAKKLYYVHKDEDFYNNLCKYMASDHSTGITFKYNCSTKDAFKKCSELKDKIREKWSESDMRNVMHSSDNLENMKNESQYYV